MKDLRRRIKYTESNVDFDFFTWRDTVMVPPAAQLTLVFTANDFVGLTMAHCSVLQHEDLGMVWLFTIEDMGKVRPTLII
jgi:hypothetical protein